MKRGRAAFVYGIMAWVFVWLLFLGFCLDVRCFLVISYIVVFNIFFHDFIIGGSTRYFSCCWNRCSIAWELGHAPFFISFI